MIKEYKNHVDLSPAVDANFLENLINRSRTHCFNFLAVLNAPEDLQKMIKNGQIKSLEKAAIIAKAKTESLRNSLLKSCLEGASLNQLKQESLQQKKQDGVVPSLTLPQKKRPGKQASKINLGSTMNKHVIVKLIKLVSRDPIYAKFKEHFNQMQLDDFRTCAKTFSSLIQIMEKVEAH